MNDLERDLRTLLGSKAGGASIAPRPEPRVLKRARRRQVGTVLGASIGVVAVLALATLTLGSLLRSEPVTPAVPSTITRSLNGIGITFPETWHLIDPDAAGLNGSATPDLPRLVLALSPQEPDELLACPGMVEGTPPTFLMTIQEEPLALAGEGSGPWPVELEPMGADTSQSGCYPGWGFLRAGWTAAGRTFEARVGLAPDVTDADREALFAAFTSMTFEPIEGAPSTVVLATGTAGGEDWELIATRQPDGLSLTLQAETFGTGTGGFDPTSDELQLTDHVFGSGSEAERVVFAAVPAGVTLIVAVGPAFAVEPGVLDVPDEIDPRLNAFVVVVDADTDIAFRGFDATDDLVVSGGIAAEGTPLEIALPEPDEVLFDGRLNNCWWSLDRTSEGPGLERLRLVSPLGTLLNELHADVGLDAPPLQLMMFDCPTDDSSGLLVFGVVSDEAATVRWGDEFGSEGLPDCLEAAIPSGFCVFLLDLDGPGVAIALDADGNEIARVPYG